MGKLFGAIEAGGTKFVCSVGTGPDDLDEPVRIPTTTPQETLGQVLEYFRQAVRRRGPLTALGIGSFGPVNLDPGSPLWGHVTKTPKPHWSQASVAPFFRDQLNVPVAFDTDVNAAALGESLWGAGQGLEDVIYLTVGTGIGAGVISGGRLVHGAIHPELGHFLLPKRSDDSFAGHCPFHGHCLEGLASGPAIQARWGKPGSELAADHPAWELEAHYLALGLHTMVVAYSPRRIILGGGVSAQPGLLPLVRQKLLASLNGYVEDPLLTPAGVERFLVAPGLGTRSGLLGSLALARELAP